MDEVISSGGVCKFELDVQGTGLRQKKLISKTASGYGRFNLARFAFGMGDYLYVPSRWPSLHLHIGLVHSQIFETTTSEILLTRIGRSKIGNPSRSADTL